MSPLKHRLPIYLETISGEHLDLVTERAPSLPLFLRERFAIFSTRLFGRKFLLALEAEGGQTGSPGEYAKHAETLKEKLGEAVIFVLANLPSYARNRMVQMGIPFIVPGSQTFIPNSLIDLRERFPQPNSKRKERLSPAGQCTLIYHLLRGRLAEMSLKDIAQKVQYSPMMMTKVKQELEAAGICRTVRRGRSTVLNFGATGRVLWEQAQPHLNSPAKKTHWIQWAKPGHPALLAGMSALSQQTMIADDRLPTYALPLAVFQDFLNSGALACTLEAETATARIELWSYDPQLLGDGRTVDPLSLFLSLRENADERVQQQLEQLIAEIKW